MQLPIGLHLTLENVEFDRVLRQAIGQSVLRRHCGRQPCAVRHGQVVFDVGLLQCLPLFIRQLLTYLGELLVQREDLGPFGRTAG